MQEKWQCKIASSLGGGFAGTPNNAWGTGLYGLRDYVIIKTWDIQKESQEQKSLRIELGKPCVLSGTRGQFLSGLLNANPILMKPKKNLVKSTKESPITIRVFKKDIKVFGQKKPGLELVKLQKRVDLPHRIQEKKNTQTGKEEFLHEILVLLNIKIGVTVFLKEMITLAKCVLSEVGTWKPTILKGGLHTNTYDTRLITAGRFVSHAIKL